LITAELYQQGRPIVIIERNVPTDNGAWARLQAAMARGVVSGSVNRMDVRVDVFYAELVALREVRTVFRQEITFGPTLEAQLRLLAADRRARESVATTPEPQDLLALSDELEHSGFKRELKPFQLENLATILRLPHGADFSVPGAGKTTVALAGFALNRARGHVEQMLVIGPIAAFQSWKDDLVACLDPAPRITVHRGPGSIIPENTELLLTNYNRVASDYDHVRKFVARKPTQIVLDEAHRIKRGASGVHGRAVLDLAYAARRRDVLTGTPAPQGAYDLVALMRFLYPGQDQQILPTGAYNERDGRDDEVLVATSNAIARYFVRTPKSRLMLPTTQFEVISQPMGAIQQAIYDALLGRYRGGFELKMAGRREFGRLGRIVMYLLEAATNPMLLVAGSDTSDEDGFAHPPLPLSGDEALADLLSRYRDFEMPWKYDQTATIVADAAGRGEKVIVWSTFVRNLNALDRHLAAFQPALVHGNVPPEDGATPGVVTREAELQRFRNDPACSVLLANPAACGEGISLHHWCHHAVYLDRTFNAGHFLQSQDRIHRLGLEEGTVTQFTILLSAGSIDESVDSRLREKVTALGRLMNDPGLVRVALPESDDKHDDPPVFADDMQAVVAHIKSANADVA
jgi:SNF2 family DNA or RNA helicase